MLAEAKMEERLYCLWKDGWFGGSVGVFRAGTEAGPLMDADER